MDKPCKYCDKSTHKDIGAFEQECEGACEQFNVYADGMSAGLDKLLERGNAILKKIKIKGEEHE